MAAVVDQTPNKAETAANLFASAAVTLAKNGPDFASIRSKVRKYNFLFVFIIQLQLFYYFFNVLINNLFFFQMALVSPTEEQFDLLQQRLRQRLDEGRGETIFDVGVGDGK